jgi:hypothetical protein
MDSQDGNTNVDNLLWEPKCLKCKKHRIVKHIQELKIESGKKF